MFGLAAARPINLRRGLPFRRQARNSIKGVAMTNEERFIASCEEVGEADVRDKLSTGRYGERKTVWAGSWLEKVESGKSDATRAEERSSLLRNSTTANRYFARATSNKIVSIAALVAVVAGLLVVFKII
jgi:hypothetical protein